MRLPGLVVACLLLAGCSSSGGDDDPAPSVSSTTTGLAPAVPAPPPLTDTMHLLDAPHAAAASPDGSDDIRVPVPAFTDSFGNALLQTSSDIGVSWTIPRQELDVIEGNATLWVDVHGTVTYPGVNRGCFWNVMLTAKGDDGSQVGAGSQCIAEDSVVRTGVRPLIFRFSAVDASAIQGDTLTLTLFANGAYSPGSGIDVLTGSVEHDSHVAVRGLLLTLDTETYLQ